MEDREYMVSIWCMCYNHEKYVAQTLDSFLMQETDFSFEIIISDDASTDGTADIIRAYAEKYPDIIRPILLENNMFSSGKNLFAEYFFERTKGRYVAFCEGDDYWTDSSKLQRQVDFLLNSPDYAACAHNTLLKYCGGKQVDRALICEGNGDRDIDLATLLSGTSYSFHTSSLMIRSELVCAPPDFYWVAHKSGFLDYAINLWAYLNGRVRFLDRTMSVYRINSTATAWSSGVDGQYRQLRRFIKGEIEMLRAFAAHTSGEERLLSDKEVLEREFELMYIEGRDREQRKLPYRDILRTKPFRYRFFNFIKSYIPGLSVVYRKIRGYID